jgi:DNA-binding MarR family transcriptional regulator
MTIPLIHPENRAVRKACGTRLMSAEGSAQPPLPSCCCVLHLNVVSTTIVLTSLSRSRIVLSMSNRLINTGRKPRFDSIHQQAYLSLWRTYDRLKVVEDALFLPFEISAQQYNALRLLHAVHPGTMPTRILGNKLISRAPDMTRMLDRLEERQFVHRERRPENRRVVEVGISATGLQLLENLSQRVREGHQRQLGHLSSAEITQLITLLQRARDPHEEPGGRWHNTPSD